jgi:hypothetical protein
MLCSFRFVPEPDNEAVTLRLFRADGLARAEVTGPLLRPGSHRVEPRVDRCITAPGDGFDLAIRIANSTDAELVVTGDPTLWQDRWGMLDMSGRPLRPVAMAAYFA